MKVKCFDFEHETDLENAINKFITSEIEIISINYQASHFSLEHEQIYSFSVLILYNNKTV